MLLLSVKDNFWKSIYFRVDVLSTKLNRIFLLMILLSSASYAQNADFQDDLQALISEISEDSASHLEVLSEPFILDINTSVAQATPSASATLQDTNISTSSDAVTLNFQDADISALINSVSQITGKSFIVDPRVKGKVTLVSGSPLQTDQVYDVFLSVLEVHGFAAVDSGGLTKILPANIIKQQPTRTSTGEQLGENDEQVTQVYSLEHASVQELTPIFTTIATAYQSLCTTRWIEYFGLYRYGCKYCPCIENRPYSRSTHQTIRCSCRYDRKRQC